MEEYSSSGTKQKSVVIYENESLSDLIDLSGYHHFGLIIPDTWTPADITFQVAAFPSGPFVDLCDTNGVEVILTAKAGTGVSLDGVALSLAPWRFVKVRSGTKITPVAQLGGNKKILIPMKI